VSAASWDVVVVGAGIVGLASALAMTEKLPGARIAVLDKEDEIARHQTGHNSGVIHSGIYYRPGSLRARLCVTGARRLVDYCRERDIPYELCGKVIVATDEREIPALDELERRGVANKVPNLRRLSPSELRTVEPHARGIAGLYSPSTGIVDYGTVARSLAADMTDRGVDILRGHAVRAIRMEGDALTIETGRGSLQSRYLINCAGLHADRVARRAGLHSSVRIIPFRGEYYMLSPEAGSLVRALLYPVPDPALPFLGVHFTRTVDGRVEAGPNAVLALAREGYTRSAVDLRDVYDAMTFPGFWRLSIRYWRTGLAEYRRSFSRARFAAALRRLVPELRDQDLLPGPTGVRAQAVSRDGRLIDDFVVERTPRAVHVLNAPSPAATASLAIGEYVADLAVSAISGST
jgi:L-2-hydroxyglutarate oxidase LhgO